MRTIPLGSCLAVLVLGSVACAERRAMNPEPALRAGIDLPNVFVVDPAVDLNTSLSELGSAACRTPMVDPRDGSRIYLVRSAAGQGDYRVEDERYGVGLEEVLRLECSTGRPLGVAKRR